VLAMQSSGVRTFESLGAIARGRIGAVAEDVIGDAVRHADRGIPHGPLAPACILYEWHHMYVFIASDTLYTGFKESLREKAAMPETPAHRRAGKRAAGAGGGTEVPLRRKRRLNALTKGGGRATEIERRAPPIG